MILLPHAVVGAAIGAKLNNPFLAFVLGILSHHFLDSFPHLDYGSRLIKKAGPRFLGRNPEPAFKNQPKFNESLWKMFFLDFILTWFVFLIILMKFPETYWLSVLTGAFGGVLPDLINSSPLWSGWLKKKFTWARYSEKIHSYFHWTVTTKEKFWGLFWQAIFIILAFYLLFY